MSRSPELVLGVDAGGTSTRAVVVSLDGEILARSRGEGANPRSARNPAEALAGALRDALAGVDPQRVAGGVFGLAGSGAAGRALAEQLAGLAWEQAGLPGRPVVVPDLAVAFAAATPLPDGALLLSGTGAVAALLRDRQVSRRCDGYGWLVGDEGSGVWIGREAVRAALAALDGREEPTALVDGVSAALRCDGDAPEGLAQRLVGAVYGAEPARLAILAPVVDAAARAGDPVARRITAEAVAGLLRSAKALGPLDDGTPFVLAGSLLTRPTLLAEGVRAGLAELGVHRPLRALDGAAGAAALAARGRGAGDAAHRRLSEGQQEAGR
ncbi:N-acetylglucosamine kinase [Peterkaempfera sp. SMS 1(5)a]|uniref:N-acetylglucosamine kinase n=1 Tax=Peterkaempfera podocarpi TaxID=3232308 RepID=UPI00366A64DA